MTQQTDSELRQRISEIFVKWNIPTRQAAISEIVEFVTADRTPPATTEDEGIETLGALLLPLIFGKDFRKLNAEHTRIYDKVMQVIRRHEAKAVADIEKAYGGCHLCYGKGYATVNEYASGYATDGDIGGLEGHFRYKIDNIKPCSCDRGTQIAAMKIALAPSTQAEGTDV